MEEEKQPLKKTDLIQPLCSSVSSYNRVAKYLPYNSDEVWKKTNNIDTYVEMSHDPIIKACVETKKNLITGQGFEIVGGDPKVREFINNCFTEYYSGNIQEDLYQILSAMSFGFSITEKIYKIINGKMVIHKLTSIPQDSIIFNMNDFGDILSVQQYSNSKLVPLSIEKFILFSWNYEGNNPYGTSDIRAAYIPWFSKKQVMAYLAMFLEKYGMPYILAKYDGGNQALASELQEVVQNLMAATGAVLPKEVDIDLVNVEKTVVDAFLNSLMYYDKQISTSLLIPDLIGFNQTEGGSYNLGEEQIKILQLNMDRHRLNFQSIINEQLIKQLVDINFSNVSNYPGIIFKPTEKEDIFNRIDKFVQLTKNGIKPQLETVRQIMKELKFPFNPSEFEVVSTVYIPEGPGEIKQDKNKVNETEEINVNKYKPRAKQAYDKIFSLAKEPEKITQIYKLLKYCYNDQQKDFVESELKDKSINIFKSGKVDVNSLLQEISKI